MAKNSSWTPDALDNPLWGAESIGEALGINERKAYHLLLRGCLPATKVGRTWVSTRRRLLARFNGTDGFVPPPKAKAAPPVHVPKSLKRKLRPEQRAGA